MKFPNWEQLDSPAKVALKLKMVVDFKMPWHSVTSVLIMKMNIYGFFDKDSEEKKFSL